MPKGVALNDEQRALARAHRALEPVLARVEGTADLVGVLREADLVHTLRVLLAELHTTLLPHLTWEDEVVYPRIERVVEGTWATRCLRIQHVELRAALERLETAAAAVPGHPEHAVLSTLAGELHSFHALTLSHLEQEEQVLRLLP